MCLRICSVPATPPPPVCPTDPTDPSVFRLFFWSFCPHMRVGCRQGRARPISLHISASTPPRPHKHTEQYDKQKNASVAHGKSRHEGLSEGSSGGGEEAARVSAGSSPSRERLTVLVKMLFTIKIHFFAFPLGF